MRRRILLIQFPKGLVTVYGSISEKPCPILTLRVWIVKGMLVKHRSLTTTQNKCLKTSNCSSELIYWHARDDTKDCGMVCVTWCAILLKANVIQIHVLNFRPWKNRLSCLCSAHGAPKWHFQQHFYIKMDQQYHRSKIGGELEMSGFPLKRIRIVWN